MAVCLAHKGEIKELVRGRVEENLNELVETKTQKMTQVAWYKCNEQRQGYRNGYYNRNLGIFVSKTEFMAKMLTAIHTQESKKSAREKTKVVVEELRSTKLKKATKKVENGIEETLAYCDFLSEH